MCKEGESEAWRSEIKQAENRMNQQSRRKARNDAEETQLLSGKAGNNAGVCVITAGELIIVRSKSVASSRRPGTARRHISRESKVLQELARTDKEDTCRRSSMSKPTLIFLSALQPR